MASSRQVPPWVGCLMIFLGLPMFGVFLITLALFGYEGMLYSAGLGALLALAAWMLAWGGLALAGRVLSGRPGCILMLAVALVAALAGPAASGVYYRFQESSTWGKIQDSRRLEDWAQYQEDIPAPFRRPEYMARLMLAQAVRAREQENATGLRQILAEIEARHRGDPAYRPAAEEARSGLATLFEKASARLDKADPALRKAFSALIADLSQRPDGVVYVVFSTGADLKAPPGTQEMLRLNRQAPEVLASFPQGNAPVVPEGEAFAPAQEKKRQATFLGAMQTAFRTVFSPGLLDLQPLPKDMERAGNLVFQVRSQVRRTNDFYQYSRQGKIVGLLFEIEVLWQFDVYDRQGRRLYTSMTRSLPAQEVRFRLDPDDPAWAPYSIMMDSAYYNYCRGVVKRFGVPPPPVRNVYTF